MYFTSTFKGVYDVWNTYLGTNAYMHWVYIAICNCNKKKGKKKLFQTDRLTHVLTSD